MSIKKIYFFNFSPPLRFYLPKLTKREAGKHPFKENHSIVLRWQAKKIDHSI